MTKVDLLKEDYLKIFANGFTINNVENWKEIAIIFAEIGFTINSQMIKWIMAEGYEKVVKHYIYSNMTKCIEILCRLK